MKLQFTEIGKPVYKAPNIKTKKCQIIQKPDLRKANFILKQHFIAEKSRDKLKKNFNFYHLFRKFQKICQ